MIITLKNCRFLSLCVFSSLEPSQQVVAWGLNRNKRLQGLLWDITKVLSMKVLLSTMCYQGKVGKG